MGKSRHNSQILNCMSFWVTWWETAIALGPAQMRTIPLSTVSKLYIPVRIYSHIAASLSVWPSQYCNACVWGLVLCVISDIHFRGLKMYLLRIRWDYCILCTTKNALLSMCLPPRRGGKVLEVYSSPDIWKLKNYHVKLNDIHSIHLMLDKERREKSFLLNINIFTIVFIKKMTYSWQLQSSFGHVVVAAIYNCLLQHILYSLSLQQAIQLIMFLCPVG